MPPAHISAALFAVALWGAIGCSAPACATEPPTPARTATEEPKAASGQTGAGANRHGNILPAKGDWRQSLAQTWARLHALVESAYVRVPALVIALSAFLVLPAVALASHLVHTAARRKARRAAIRAAGGRVDSMEPTTEMPEGEALPRWSHDAWLRLESGAAATLPLAGYTTRIGRHRDNDIRLPDSTVHVHHAVIERTQDEAFVITDLTGKQGIGVRVNGERLARAHLSDGDVIELGRTRLTFESAPV